LLRQFTIVSLLVLVLRLPFLNQAIQGDDVYYLYGAAHAQVDLLHPTHARYAFQGRMVDMRGHPHPPLNSWFLGGLVALLGGVSEPPFHAAYILFSFIAAWSALGLARRFSPRALPATLLFLVTPPFIVNGNSLEADLPFVAFWLASIALFVRAVDARSLVWLSAAGVAMVLAGLTAFQSVVLVPILLLYGWKWRPAWIAALTAPTVIGVWQIFERATSGALPATILAGYMQTYDLQALSYKIKNAVALIGHLGWIVCPILAVAAFGVPWKWLVPPVALAAYYDPNPLFWVSIGVGLTTLVWCLRHRRDFAAAWILIFFASALIIFFAGSARYLLPIALPAAILVSRQLSSRWLYAGVLLGALLSGLLAIVNYQHWDGYRKVALSSADDASKRRVWINAEWGLRFYLEQEGAEPLLQEQRLHPGEMVLTSELASNLKRSAAGTMLAPVRQTEIRSAIPLRLVAMDRPAGYSTTYFGLRPFDISSAPIDRVETSVAVEKKPILERLPMSAPEAVNQIVSGIYDLESGGWRWMAEKAVVLLKYPSEPEPVYVRFTIPSPAPARQVSVYTGSRLIARQGYSGPGSYVLTTQPVDPAGTSASITIEVDKLFSAPPDRRELGIILSEIGFGHAE
jgi:hypothetical protein